MGLQLQRLRHGKPYGQGCMQNLLDAETKGGRTRPSRGHCTAEFGGWGGWPQTCAGSSERRLENGNGKWKGRGAGSGRDGRYKRTRRSCATAGRRIEWWTRTWRWRWVHGG